MVRPKSNRPVYLQSVEQVKVFELVTSTNESWPECWVYVCVFTELT